MLFPILNPVLSIAAGRRWLLSITLLPRSFYSVVKGGPLLIIQDGKVTMMVIMYIATFSYPKRVCDARILFICRYLSQTLPAL